MFVTIAFTSSANHGLVCARLADRSSSDWMLNCFKHIEDFCFVYLGNFPNYQRLDSELTSRVSLGCMVLLVLMLSIVDLFPRLSRKEFVRCEDQVMLIMSSFRAQNSARISPLWFRTSSLNTSVTPSSIRPFSFLFWDFIYLVLYIFIQLTHRLVSYIEFFVVVYYLQWSTRLICDHWC